MADVILSILAHPDDAEFLCAGTLIRLRTERGFDIHIATMTAGDCGSASHAPDEISRLRRQEGANSAALIGAHYHCLGERDLLVFYNQGTLAKATRLLRLVQPAIVLTHSPADYMLDHEMTGAIARAACFAAPIPNFLRDENLGAPLPGIPHLYYCDPIEGTDALGTPITPGLHVDISTVIEQKTAMLAAHASQRDWLLKHHGLDQYTMAMRAWSARRGREIGAAFAEGFRQHLGHGYPREDILTILLR